MKNILFLVTGLSLLLYCNRGYCDGATGSQKGSSSKPSEDNTLLISNSPELNNLTLNWATQYKRSNPASNIVVANVPDNLHVGKIQIYFSQGEYTAKGQEEFKWKMIVGRDAIIPIMNSNNPFLKEISRQGISADIFAQLLTIPEKRNWKNLIMGGKDASISLYMTDNIEVKENVAKFVRTNSSLFNARMEKTSEEIISSVQKDIYAIGFCRLSDVRDANTNNLSQGIHFLPVDKNGNGRIDNFENIYSNLDDFTRGVWIGKYPGVLCTSIFAMSTSKPNDNKVEAFLTWVLSDGQKYLNSNGYCDLASSEIRSNMDELMNIANITEAKTDNTSHSQGWIVIVSLLVLAGLILTGIIRSVRNKNARSAVGEINLTPALNENSIVAPKGLYFDKTHTWAFMEKDGYVKVGVDDFLQHITGRVTRVKMKEPGEKIRKGEKILTLMRNGKQLNLYSPISGTIMEQNQALTSDSSILNSSPFTDGWVYVIEPKNWTREIQFLFMGEKYKEWLMEEFNRLKDFFAVTIRSNSSAYTHIVLQDGGELTDNILAEMGPEVWEDFQTNFIDTSK